MTPPPMPPSGPSASPPGGSAHGGSSGGDGSSSHALAISIGVGVAVGITAAAGMIGLVAWLWLTNRCGLPCTGPNACMVSGGQSADLSLQISCLTTCKPPSADLTWLATYLTLITPHFSKFNSCRLPCVPTYKGSSGKMGSDPEDRSIQCPGDANSLKGTDKLVIEATQTFGMGEERRFNGKDNCLDPEGLIPPTIQSCLQPPTSLKVGFHTCLLIQIQTMFPEVVLW